MHLRFPLSFWIYDAVSQITIKINWNSWQGIEGLAPGGWDILPNLNVLKKKTTVGIMHEKPEIISDRDGPMIELYHFSKASFFIFWLKMYYIIRKKRWVLPTVRKIRRLLPTRLSPFRWYNCLRTGHTFYHDTIHTFDLIHWFMNSHLQPLFLHICRKYFAPWMRPFHFS